MNSATRGSAADSSNVVVDETQSRLNRGSGSYWLTPCAVACQIVTAIILLPVPAVADFFDILMVSPGRSAQVAVHRQEVDWARGFDNHCVDVFSLDKGKRESSDCPKPQTRARYADMGQFELWRSECERHQDKVARRLTKAGFKPLPQVLSLVAQGSASFLVLADKPLMSVAVSWSGKVQVSAAGPEGQALSLEVLSLGDDPTPIPGEVATVVVSQVAPLPGDLGLLVVVRVIPMPSPEREPYDVVRYIDVKPFCEQWSSPCSFEKVRIVAR